MQLFPNSKHLVKNKGPLTIQCNEMVSGYKVWVKKLSPMAEIDGQPNRDPMLGLA